MSASAASTASVAGWELFPHGADVGVRGLIMAARYK
jgi:hypothetical protein